MPAVILSIGKDEPLLESRNAVLRAAGYVVIAETSFRQALRAFNSGDYDAVLLCHSLDRKSVEMFASELHQRSPSTPVIQVAALGPNKQPSNVTHIESDPQKMLGSLHEAIAQASSRSHRSQKALRNNSEAPDV